MLFPTCFINYYNTAPGKAAVKVFEKNGCEMACPKQNAAGCRRSMAATSPSRKSRRARNIDSMLPYVRRGYQNRGDQSDLLADDAA